MQNVLLNTGRKMPVIGLGTSKSGSKELFDAVCYAIDAGYRHFDCALIYGNETVIGDALAAKIKEGIVKREDLFVSGKLWWCFHRPENMDMCIDESLKNLRIDYLDLYLMHFPMAHAYPGSIDIDKIHPLLGGVCPYDEEVDYVDTWNNMKKFVQSGKVRSLGVSNFNQFQISRILNECDFIPAVNQIENHPYLNQDNLIKFCQSNGIHITGYCPLGAFDRPHVKSNGTNLLADPVLGTIARKYNKTPAQVALRFNLQRGLSLIPKSSTPSRISENIQVFDFSLSDDDMSTIYSLECGKRLITLIPIERNHKYYPFRENYNE